MYPQQQQHQQQQYPYNPNYVDSSSYPPQSNFPPPAGTFHHQQPGGPVNLNMPPSPPDNSSSGGWREPGGLFVEKEIRQAFVSKVYSILTVQLVLTSILIGAFVLHEPTKTYFADAAGQIWLWLGFGIFLVSYMILVCVESARRSTPINFILLSASTLGYGFVAAVTSCRYDTQTVLYAFIATGVSCLLIALFAKTTKLDMTGCGTVLCLVSLAQLVIGLILVAILGPSAITSILLSVGGAFVASLYLIFDLQLIMGGRKCELSPEEYILGAIMLYTDVIMIFLYLLEIFNQLSKD